MLTHDPVWFKDVPPGPYLTLAGHTHGGQINPVPGVSSARLIGPRTAGLYREGEDLLYVSRGLGVVGAFLVGIVAAVIVLAGAVISLPFWPEDVRAMWRGHGATPAPTTAGIDLQAVRADAAAIANAIEDAVGVRLYDLPITSEKVYAALNGKV